MTEQELRRVAEIVRQAGAQKQSDAGYGGMMHDNGGGALIAQADAFIAGLDRTLPVGWEAYAQEAKRNADPEYAEFRRLRAKFGE